MRVIEQYRRHRFMAKCNHANQVNDLVGVYNRERSWRVQDLARIAHENMH